MGAYIVTGLRGKEHVTSADAGALNAGIFGTGRYVMNTAEQFAAEIVSNNIVRIKAGDLVNQGRHIRIEVNDYEDMMIENGTQSAKRNDLIVMRYKKDTSTTLELESAELVVIKGTAGTTAADPTYTSGDILAGATQDDFPLYRVELNGLNIEKVTPLFSTVPNLAELNTKIAKMFMVEMIQNVTTTGGGNIPTTLSQKTCVPIFGDLHTNNYYANFYPYNGNWYIRVEDAGKAVSNTKLDWLEVFYINRPNYDI